MQEYCQTKDAFNGCISEKVSTPGTCSAADDHKIVNVKRCTKSLLIRTFIRTPDKEIFTSLVKPAFVE